jgi:hypothetical protein
MNYSSLAADELRAIEKLLSRDVRLAQERMTRRLQELEAFSVADCIQQEEKTRLIGYVSLGLEAARVELEEASLALAAFINGVIPVGSAFAIQNTDASDRSRLR